VRPAPTWRWRLLRLSASRCRSFQSEFPPGGQPGGKCGFGRRGLRPTCRELAPCHWTPGRPGALGRSALRLPIYAVVVDVPLRSASFSVRGPSSCAVFLRIWPTARRRSGKRLPSPPHCAFAMNCRSVRKVRSPDIEIIHHDGSSYAIDLTISLGNQA